MVGKTETENLLETAKEIARRAFNDPSEACVMDLFRRLCMEQDERACAATVPMHNEDGETLH